MMPPVIHPEPVSFARLLDPEQLDDLRAEVPSYERLVDLLWSAFGALLPLPPRFSSSRRPVDKSSR